MLSKKMFFACLSFFSFNVDLLANDLNDKGIGPVKSVTLNEKLDDAMVKKGQEIFKSKCLACHDVEKKKVGPAIKGVTERRSPEWIMNMILNPAEMIEKNAQAKALFEEMLVPMTFQNVSESDTRAILEYFISVDKGGSQAGEKKVDKEVKKDSKKK